MTPPILDAIPAFVWKKADGSGVHNEAAFRYFLRRERRRALRSNRLLILVLVKRKSVAGSRERVLVDASAVFESLSACVREVDFIGWYREGVIAAALVTASGAACGSAKQAVQARVTRALHEKLPHDTVGDSLRVRVVQLAVNPRT